MVKAGSTPICAGVIAQQPRADGVEGAGPGKRGAERAPKRACERPEERARAAARLARRGRLPPDPLDPPRHLDGGAARERHQENAAGIGAVRDEMHHAMRECRRLARARAGDDEERAVRSRIDAVQDGAALVGIELVEVGRGHFGESLCMAQSKTNHVGTGCATHCSDLILRSRRSRRLEGWPLAAVHVAILRDASFGRSSG